MKICWEHQIWPYYLVPHTSHVTQPLDLSCFAPLKGKYRQVIADLASFDDALPIKKIRFLDYYQQARENSWTKPIILAGWLAAGICPWNPLKILQSR